MSVAGGDIHDLTTEASAEALETTCEPLLSSGRWTLGVNGVRRPSSAAVIRDVGGDGYRVAEVFLTGGENLISRFDQSVLEMCWRRGTGVSTGDITGGVHLTNCMGERSRSGS